MHDAGTIIAYLLTAGAIVISPGPDTTLILRHALTSGLSAGSGAVVGTTLGLVCHTLATVLGLSLILAASETALAVIAVVGAAYLGYLGLQAFWAGAAAVANGSTNGASRPVSAWRAGRDGLVCNLFNPKIILLFLSLMPQFVSPQSASVPAQLAVMGAVYIAMSLLWQIPLVVLAGRVRGWLNRPSVQRAINWTTGAILLGFAGLMLYDHVL